MNWKSQKVVQQEGLLRSKCNFIGEFSQQFEWWQFKVGQGQMELFILLGHIVPAALLLVGIRVGYVQRLTEWS